MAAIWTIESEEDGNAPGLSDERLDNALWADGTARARRAGLPKAEPGAGSAGRGAAKKY